ncbi:M56 family metallopeptidase [Nocardioides sp. T2.26MG-1]|uniref:M56 family metallopeptidase n=1 Tax=Nocardioides sp. T2.26MG-1 TaxID=3041166 RepID=UPI002477C638|nr:M56 family metallopeptidase [Nocardioides sp. T2.26MG-1]CAI9418026.1 Protease HtpX [Nocardioides sp. T2.26MG-1]
MSAALLFLGVAAVLAGPMARGLSRASWPSRAPSLGMAAWLSLQFTTLLSIVLVGLSLLVGDLPHEWTPIAFFHACADAVQHHSWQGNTPLAWMGGTLALAMSARVVGVLLFRGARRRRELGKHHALLRLVGSPTIQSDLVILDHPMPAAYCIPGRRGVVVISEGALGLLSPSQIAQVLAHERAHLRARHHRVLFLADVLASAFFGRFGLANARMHVAQLAELHADDAVPAPERPALAEAVVAMASRDHHPLGALAATGGATAARVLRLTAGTRPLSGVQRAAARSLVAATLAMPAVVGFIPMATRALLDYCFPY